VLPYLILNLQIFLMLRTLSTKEVKMTNLFRGKKFRFLQVVPQTNSVPFGFVVLTYLFPETFE